QRIKERWEREVLSGLRRQERRLDRPEKPWRARRFLVSAIGISTESNRCCRSGRRHGGAANWSYSRPRGGRYGSREATAGSSGGCGLAGAAPGGNETPSERPVAPYSAWLRAPCP